MPSFYSLPYPYLDFIVLSFRTSDAANNALPLLTQSQALSCLHFQQCHEVQRADTIIGVPREQDYLRLAQQSVVFSGIARHKTKLILGQKDSEELFRSPNPSDHVGQFSYAKVTEKDAQIGNDVFGLGMTFYSKHKDFSVASNRLHLHAMITSSLGVAFELDDDAAKLAMFGCSLFLSQQPATSRTFIKGVQRARLDERIMLKCGDVTTERTKGFSPLDAPASEKYSELVAQGAEEIVQNCRCVISDSRFDKIVVDLSGGKDSRMVLAAVLSIPGWQDKCRFHSKQQNPKDLEVACVLANHFGGEFDDGSPIPPFPVSKEDNLGFWRSYFFGQYHRVAAGQYSQLGKNINTINLSGGNGEVFRGFWSKVFARSIDRSSGIAELAEEIVKASPRQSGSIESTEVASLVRAELEMFPGNTAAQKLDSHYIAHRNRAHFGMRGFSFMESSLTWFPLLAPSLARAAWLLPDKDRIGSRVVKDVLMHLQPKLAEIPFEDGTSFAGEDNGCCLTEIELDRSTAGWAAAQSEYERKSRDVRRQPPRMAWTEWKPFVLNEMNALVSKYGPVAPGVQDQAEWANELTDKEPRRALEIASKVISLYDALIAR